MHLSQTSKFRGTRFLLFDNLEHLTFFFSINRRICMAEEVARFFEVFFRTGTYMIWYIKDKLYQTKFRGGFICRFLCRGWCTGRAFNSFYACKLLLLQIVNADATLSDVYSRSCLKNDLFRYPCVYDTRKDSHKSLSTDVISFK